MRFRYAPRPSSGRHYRPGMPIRLFGRLVVALVLTYVLGLAR